MLPGAREPFESVDGFEILLGVIGRRDQVRFREREVWIWIWIGGFLVRVFWEIGCGCRRSKLLLLLLVVELG